MRIEIKHEGLKTFCFYCLIAIILLLMIIISIIGTAGYLKGIKYDTTAVKTKIIYNTKENNGIKEPVINIESKGECISIRQPNQTEWIAHCHLT